jgi:hypothetical protein
MVDAISYRKEFGLIIVGAIIFISSFLWKDILVEIEEKYFPKKNGLTNRIFFTIIVTMILVFFAVYLKDIWNLTSEKTYEIDADPEKEFQTDAHAFQPDVE